MGWGKHGEGEELGKGKKGWKEDLAQEGVGKAAESAAKSYTRS